MFKNFKAAAFSKSKKRLPIGFYLFLFITIILNGTAICLFAQKPAPQIISLLKNEKWYGGAVNEAHLMPFKAGYKINLNGDNRGNQASPLFLSTAGRYLWSSQPFEFSINDKNIVINKTLSTVTLGQAGKNLSAAYNYASKHFFQFAGKMPDSLLFLKPQYNTWIELLYDQEQNKILAYAKAIVKNGFPTGVLMIDDNWFSYNGNLDFRKDRFADAKKLIDELHHMGFKVMVWVSPFVSPDTENYRELLSKRLLIYDGQGTKLTAWEKADKPLIVKWWNGYSAQIDLTNPQAISWFDAKLQYLKNTYGVDGFKFDAGDMEFYPANMITYKKANANEMCELWGTFGLKYPLNEYRAIWKQEGQPLAERLRDKFHTWNDLQKLIPGVTLAGILGYPFVCPDMIGGGDYSSFINNSKLDQDLIVRSAQCQALMPMMQFSVAPWRVLDDKREDAVLKAVKLREKFTPYIFSLVEEASKTGVPVVRSMEYEFPNQGYAEINSQFMLGERYLIAPVLEKSSSKKVYFPKGTWKDLQGTIFHGPLVKDFKVNLETLPVFESIH